MPKKQSEALVTQEQSIVSAPPVHAIENTVKRLESVRKYIQRNLNVGQRKLLKKIGSRVPTPAEKEQLKELEIDFGTIPGVKKPFLKQPGAEKIALWLHVRPSYVTEVTPIPDRPGHIEVHGRCKLMAVGPVPEVEVFSGPLASCTSMESNYRFRWVKMNPPPTYEWAQQEGRIGKEMGTHRSFQKDGKWIWQERHENPNIYDEHNKVRQMGEKRMLVKSLRNFGALSELFVEDPSEWVLDDESNTAAEEPAVPGSVVKSQEPEKPKPSVEIRWPADTTDVAIIHLPDLPGAADLAAKIMDLCDWRDDIKAWQCAAVNVPEVAQLATELGLQVVEIDQGKPKTAPPPAPAPPPPARVVESVETEHSGNVSMVTKQPGKTKGNDYYIVICGGKSLYCYHKSLFEHIAKAKGQDCTFVIQTGNYPKIVAVKRIGATEFHENLPVVDRSAQ